MKKVYLIAIAIALGLTGLFLIGFGSRKNVTVTIDGQSEEVYTSAWTVSGFIREAGIKLSEMDYLDPPLSTWLVEGDTIIIETASSIDIYGEDKSISTVTYERVVANILADLDVRIFPGDQLLINGQPYPIDIQLSPGVNYDLQVIRAQPVTLKFDEQLITFSSSASTLGEALWENGIELEAADRLHPPAGTKLDKPIEAELQKSREIAIQTSQGTIKSRSAGETVGEALLQAGLPLQGLDYSLPDANAPLPSDGKIQVVRVKEDLLLESEPIPFDTETQPAADLEIDNRKIIQPGVYGLNTKRVRVRYEDDIEVSQQIEAEYVSQEPQTEIVGYGTKIVPHTMNTPAGQITYWRALNMYAVSYNPTSAGDNVTATGMLLEKGIAAIDPHYIPYFTKMYIPGYGEAIAADTGGGVKGRMIDLGFSDHDYVSWHQWVTVYFLWPPPENIVWIIP
jgi:uncharacterized protein YabE (DUF348 family)